MGKLKSPARLERDRLAAEVERLTAEVERLNTELAKTHQQLTLETERGKSLAAMFDSVEVFVKSRKCLAVELMARVANS